MTPSQRAEQIKRHAEALGFCRVGITDAAPSARVRYLETWLATGRAGSMGYLHRNHAIRTDPRNLLPGARSVIVVGLSYHQEPPPAPKDDQPRGRVAMYAWGADYHRVVKDRLSALVSAMRQSLDSTFTARVCVDTVPILERELAARAGVGWIGKNTLILHQDVGSYVFLGEVVTTLELAADAPATDHCGSCTRCLDACPTRAFPAAYEMDASRCISYLTIEHRGEIEADFQAAIGDWVFGCDVCQQVCPYNVGAPRTTHFDTRPPGPRPALHEFAKWMENDDRSPRTGSAMNRATPAMLRRNTEIALNNARRPTPKDDGSAVPDGA